MFQNQESCWANALVAVAWVWVQGGASWNHRFTVQASFDSANGDGIHWIFVSTHIAEAKRLAQIALAKKIWTKMTHEKDGLLDTLSWVESSNSAQNGISTGSHIMRIGKAVVMSQEAFLKGRKLIYWRKNCSIKHSPNVVLGNCFFLFGGQALIVHHRNWSWIQIAFW